VLTYLAGTDLFVVVLAFILGIWAIFAARKAQDEMHTGYSLSEALILALINPKYDGRFYIELEIKPCGLGSRIRDMETVTDPIYWCTFRLLFIYFGKQNLQCGMNRTFSAKVCACYTVFCL
jgi:hypothetical protein